MRPKPPEKSEVPNRRDAEALLAAIIGSTNDAVISEDLDGRVTSWNHSAERLTGYTAAEAIGQPALRLFAPADADESARVFARIRAGERVEGYRTTCRTKDGRAVPIALTASPVMRDDGVINGVSIIAQNITERVEGERHRELLMAELDHRVKNTLIAVQSIAHQTAKGSSTLDGFMDAFEARLVALSRTHNLLLERHWTGAPLRELVTNELLPYINAGVGDATRFQVEGEPVQVTPKQAIALGLGLHELTTNAVKHGALSAPEGSVSVAWRVIETSDGRYLDFDWTERGGPAVSGSGDSGFGSRLIERGLRAELRAEVSLRFEREGLRMHLRAPLDEVRT